ncbi:hypothetical protein CDD80_3610 [Ophiocordyceps camponoti-rufipedis]|uniref:Clock-controlled protein 8 n=1 Tax=Ophiocordyceps camponoti-rufipedis TaxID=2004952 RepID=A0A2C5Z244_9HYPO|nr:hypothetical protein CDD80_3610 [Ophiocordyceps camponoti-rufipedis]
MTISGPRDLDPKRHEPVNMTDSWNSSLAYRPPLTTVKGTPSVDAEIDRQLSLDDPDVRLAAEALGDLRADFVSTTPEASPTPDQSSQQPPRQEPLLSLLTTSHPLVASTIGGASSAYGGAKNLSPRFKSGAEYVEGYLTPIANTVNSVGRVTGVEGGVRWFLGGSRRHDHPLDPELGGYSHKRRKVGEGDVDADLPGAPLTLWSADPLRFDHRSPRRLSSTSTIDTLPAYDELRSPAYTETTGSQSTASRTSPWQSRLMLSTSGLSVAMSAESLRSLKYCLRLLRWTNDHMGRVIGTLKATIEEYEKTRSSPAAPDATTTANPEPEPESSRVELVNRINTLKSDILKTLQNTIETVSKYAGGALPENARVLVRRHLMSLPQRFRLATMTTDGGSSKDGESAISEGAQKVLVLAKEGLDMVTQVSGVVDGTIMSAEEWCERMDRKRQSPRDEEEAGGAEASGDVKMA